MQERIDTSSSNAPTRLGKVQISLGMDDNQIPMGCLRGGCWSLELISGVAKVSLREESYHWPLWGQWYVFTLSSHWHLTTFTIFQKPELVSKDYDLIHFLKEWFIALCKCTVIIPKLNWNLSHELKIVTSLYILELTLLYPQPCSYLQVIQAWAHFRQKIFNERNFVPVKV